MNFGNRKSYGFYFAPVGKVNKAPFLPRKILSSVAAFASSAEINHGRSNLTLMLCLIPFKTTTSHNHSFSSAKQQYLIKGATRGRVADRKLPFCINFFLRLTCIFLCALKLRTELTVELFGKAHRAGSDCRSGGA